MSAGIPHASPDHPSVSEAGAIEADRAATYVSGLFEDVLSCLQEVAGPQRKNALRQVLEENIDFPGIARFAMGRYWRLASDAERDEFVRLLQELLVRTSNAGSAEYKGGRFSILESRTTTENETLVRSVLNLEGGPSVRIDWLLRPHLGRFRIQDLIVEDISTRITLRDLFAAAIQEKGGTVTALLAAMRDLVWAPAPGAH